MSSPDEYWLKKADSLKLDGKFEEAIKALDKASEIKKSEKKSDFWCQKGMALVEMGKYDEAINCFENDLKSNGPTFQTLFEKASVLLLTKKYSESLEQFNKAYEINIEELMRHENQAKMLKDYKKFEKSLIHSDIAVKIQHIPPRFWSLKGSALYGIKKFNEAIECYQKALDLEKNDSELIYDLAKSQLMLGNIEECLIFLEKACKLDSKICKILFVDPIFEKLEDNHRFRQIRDSDKLHS